MTKKEIIVQTAIELFARDGFEATSIQKLAEEAQVAQGLLYRHFKNKQALLEHLRSMCIAQVADTLLPYSIPELSFKQAFEQHIKRSCAYLKKYHLLWKVFHASRMTEINTDDVFVKEQVNQLIIRPMAGKLKADGYEEATLLAWTIFSLIDGMTGLYVVHPNVYPLQKIEKFLIEKINMYEKYRKSF